MKFFIQDPSDWARRTFGKAELGDKRRTERLVSVASDMAKHTGSSVAYSCEGDEAALEGTYRFIRNENIQPHHIRQAGFGHAVEQALCYDEVLAIEDTTSLSYRHQVADQLGKLGQVKDKSRGWWVHSSLLVETNTWQTLGLAYQEWWCRPDNAEDASEKESGKWQATSVGLRHQFGDAMSRVITVCDREADIFDYLHDKSAREERFVVRCHHIRQIKESEDDLLTYLQQQPVLGEYQITVAQKGVKDSKGKPKNRPSRQVKLSLQAARITYTCRKQKIALNVVLAQEVTPVAGEEMLRWILLTSEPIKTREAALKVVDIYSCRWRIEEFHKAWKSGAGAERQRMLHPDNLERTVSILAFIAIRLMQLRESFTLPTLLRERGLKDAAKKVEAMRCDRVLSEDEWRLLWQLDQHKSKKSRSSTEVPSLQWAYHAIARLGGFTDSKGTGIAGWPALWDGWEKLQERMIGYYAAKEMMAENG